MNNVLFALWFFLPAGLANASPVFAAKIGVLHPLLRPLDFGKKFRGHRILGDNKTWLGILSAVFVGFVIIALQKYGFNHSEWIRSISGSVNYAQPKIWWLGPVLGFGALLGDAIESFFKRQIGVSPGHSWFPFDQIDYILGGLILSLVIIRLTTYEYLLIIVIWLLLHLISSYIGYLLGLKSKPI
jgi:CDP-2,3-bis-(O-geranylgeranyl)-sn-glycerol synthase